MRGLVSNCYFCGTEGPAGAACAACLVTIPQPSPEAPRALQCPRCPGAAATTLRAVGIAPGATIHACLRCHGMFVGARAWCTLVRRRELAQAITAKLPPRAAPASQRIELLDCPSCSREMERGRFGASSNIVIDVCIADGMWLDGGEIVAVVNHLAYRQRVGVIGARRAVDAAEAPRANVIVVSTVASTAQPSGSAKRWATLGGVIVVGLAAMRVAFFVWGGHAAAPTTHLHGASESAASAATALGAR